TSIGSGGAGVFDAAVGPGITGSVSFTLPGRASAAGIAAASDGAPSASWPAGCFENPPVIAFNLGLHATRKHQHAAGIRKVPISPADSRRPFASRIWSAQRPPEPIRITHPRAPPLTIRARDSINLIFAFQ